MINRRHLLMGCWALCVSGSPLAAQTLNFESPLGRVKAVELFTSHGCSSCPPADAWLSRQKTPAPLQAVGGWLP